MVKTETVELLRISVRGVVQGVGFRPFVYQLADSHNLKGWVCNTSEDVKIEVEGGRGQLKQFVADLRAKAPHLARIENISTTLAPLVGYKQFEIRHSQTLEGKYQLVSPDIATCDACKHELLTPGDRRYRYPFTNCTNCGPRFTIIEDIPYDRPRTTMRHFQMCLQCQKEYDDPLDRRFHAQPNACPQCGPSLKLVDNLGNPIPSLDVLTSASQLLKQGEILAIKGLGGFLLACDATNEVAVSSLRHRKRRPYKPLAIMVATLEEVNRHCYLSPEEEKLLTSPQCPIVLLKWKADSSVSPLVAPNLNYLGVMLPYTPLHHVLLRESGLPLVMTSGNLSEEPIAKDNDEAIRRLQGVADYFLLHNRDIYSRYDDSVAMVELGQAQLVRRARGYAPYPIHLPFTAKQVLACGAELKNSFCLTRDKYAFLSQHIGDLENLETLEHFENTIDLYQKLFRIKPEIIAYDLHPDYLSTKYALKLAEEQGLPVVGVQHHHAHIVSCMVDNGVKHPVIGIAFDGTGYGTNGHIWGGEFLVADYRSFDRKGHLEYLPLPGGAAAIQKPCRIAISYLFALLGEAALDQNLPPLRQLEGLELDLIRKQIETGLNTPLTSSCGRLFDAVSALLGIRGKIDYEGQAAVELEMIASEDEGQDAYPFTIIEQQGMRIVMMRELFSSILSDLERGILAANISAKFHSTLAQMMTQMCQLIAKETHITTVALSGGVFQNRLLLRKAKALLEQAGFSVLTHSQAPCNDGGISLGQAVIANFRFP
jgi:hydrogenase maturation protein HypF